jgi:hypothetical protein
MARIINETEDEENPLSDNRCPLCRKKTHGGIFCSMSHYRTFLHAPNKFKDRKAIKESLEYFKPYEAQVVSSETNTTEPITDEREDNFNITDTTSTNDRGILGNIKRHMDFIARRINENRGLEDKINPF